MQVHDEVTATKASSPTPTIRVLTAHPKALLAVAMAWAAGFIDVVAWLVLYHIYVSHMTGNTAGFAQDLVSRKWVEAFHHGWPVLPFVAGLLYSAATTKLARRKRFHASFFIALITEVALLIGFLWLGTFSMQNGKISDPSGWEFYLLVSLPTAAMGLQTVTVTNINGLRVYTTYLTGSLSKFAESLVEYALWMYDRLRRGGHRRLWCVLRISPRQKALQHATLTGSLWIGFFVGALCGATMEARFALFSLIAPIAVLIAAAIVDLARPVAAADEPAPQWSAY